MPYTCILLVRCEPDESRLLYILEEGNYMQHFPIIRPIISGGFGKFLYNDCRKVQTVRKLGGGIKWVEISTVFR